MKLKLYPLQFKPIYRNYLWGGTRIAEKYGRSDAPERCAESWEISARPEADSVVSDGALKGIGLSSIYKDSPAELCGTLWEGDVFPVLIKIIDARERLSVQVHPDEEKALLHSAETKTEAWYILDSEPRSVVFAGLREGVRPRRFQMALKAKKATGMLYSLPATPGQTLFVPAGTLHAIGEGCMILEVQQNSDTTYRLYDWDRVGPDGQPRELHLERGLSSVRWDYPPAEMITPVENIRRGGENRDFRILRSDFFALSKMILAEKEEIELDGSTFNAIFAADSAVTIAWESGRATISKGSSCLVPASLGRYSLSPSREDGKSTVLITSLV